MASRRVTARAFRAPSTRSDKETPSLIEQDDPSGRGGGWHSGKYDPSKGDEIMARIEWRGHGRGEPWSSFWARWQKEFAEANARTHAWLRAFRLRVHGVDPLED